MKSFPVNILRFDSLGSTNTEAARQAVMGADEGVCVVADEQTAGRGRQQRAWSSPKGAGLYLSVVLRPIIEQRFWPLITLAAALAVNQALRKSCELETDIKWPNDVLANNKKLCGILAETIETSRGRAVIVGIGINLTRNSFPPDLQNVATSVEAAAGRVVDREVVLKALLDSFAKNYAALQQPGGVAEVIRNWSERSSYANGKRVLVTEDNQVWTGTTCGLDGNGALCVQTDDGEIRMVHAGQVETLRPAESPATS